MKISGTLDEILKIIRSCEGTRMMGECSNCPLFVLIDEEEEACEGIEFVSGMEVETAGECPNVDIFG